LLAFGASIPPLGMIGMFLFNMTMPITMVAIANILPGKPGFAFGLNCLALIIGALPFFYKFIQVSAIQPYILYVIIFSAISVFIGLKLYFKESNI
jgi:FSR family fosmidomycin resistance protein-like MFS transporter